MSDWLNENSSWVKWLCRDNNRIQVQNSFILLHWKRIFVAIQWKNWRNWGCDKGSISKISFVRHALWESTIAACWPINDDAQWLEITRMPKDCCISIRSDRLVMDRWKRCRLASAGRCRRLNLARARIPLHPKLPLGRNDYAVAENQPEKTGRARSFQARQDLLTQSAWSDHWFTECAWIFPAGVSVDRWT